MRPTPDVDYHSSVTSPPLRIAARTIAPVMIALSLIVLYRGHHLPGGGFIGGLLAASGFGLILLGNGLEAAKRSLRFHPMTFIATGLGVALVSGLVRLFSDGSPFLQGAWLDEFQVPLLGVVHLGTPLLFDIGVYLVVIGFTLLCLFSLVEADEAPEENELAAQINEEELT